MLNQQQTRWSAFMSECPWYAEYRQRKLGVKPDTLACRSGDLPREGDERLTQRVQTLLKPENLQNPVSIVGAGVDVAQKLPSSHPPETIHLLADLHRIAATPLEDQFQAAYHTDLFPQRILQMLKDGTRKCKDISLSECSERGGQLLYC